MEQEGASGKKNAIAIALMVVVLAGSGFYIYSRYQQQEADKAKLDTLVPEVSDDEIRAGRRRMEQQAETARKFLPLLKQNQNKAQEAPPKQTLPFAVPGKSEAPAGEGAAAPAEAAPAEGELPPAN